MSRAQRAIHREVASFLRRAGVPRDRPVLAAVSGGADSIALLAVLCALGQRVGVAHVHHGLRGVEADEDAAFVRERAGAAGVAYHAAHVSAAAPGAGSPEARARELRYEALRRLARNEGYAHVATAHTLDDQAETLLLRAARGTGLRGLGGIAPQSPDGVVLRPLLAMRRADLRQYLKDRDLSWREDSSNRDLAVPRNLLRSQALPAFERAHPGATRRIAELSDRARELERWLADQSGRVLEGALEAGDGGLWIGRKALLALPEPLRAPALARVLERVGLGSRTTRVHLERLTRFAEAALPGKRLSLPLRHALFADRDALWIGPLPGPRFPAACDRELQPGVPVELHDHGLRLVWTDSGDGPGASLWVPRGPTAVRVRTPEPRDQLRTHAERRPLPLREIFSRCRWSQREKAYAVVVARGGEPLGALAPSDAVGAAARHRHPAPSTLRLLGLTGAAVSVAREAGRKDGWRLRVERLSQPR